MPQNVSSFMVKWENIVPKCIILYGQMGEQCSIMCSPLESDGKTIPHNLLTFMVEWENSVPKCVILYGQMGEQWPIVCRP